MRKPRQKQPGKPHRKNASGGTLRRILLLERKKLDTIVNSVGKLWKMIRMEKLLVSYVRMIKMDKKSRRRRRRRRGTSEKLQPFVKR